jgi:hypothetical protein
MSDFQRAYSNMVLALWDNPALEQQIEKNPATLSQFGFSKVPSKVRIEKAQGDPSIVGYAQQMSNFSSGSEVTLYVPVKPPEDSAVTDGDTYCCCCCPCCTCT